MTKPTVNTGTLEWSGEHWINAISIDGENPSGWFSLFHTRYSEHGEGNTVHVFVPERGIDLVAADNGQLGDWMQHNFFQRTAMKAPLTPLVDAKFERRGTIHTDPSWVVQLPDSQVVARWFVQEAPVIAHGLFGEDAEFFTMLFFTAESAIELDGEKVGGTPYQRDIWKASIGGDRSSSVFACSMTSIARWNISAMASASGWRSAC